MRKKLSVSIVFCILSLICLVLAIYFGVFQKQISLELSDNFCYFLFDSTPSEFFDKEFDFYKETGDFRKKSFISERGNLVLVLTPKQQKKWRETEWLTSINNASIGETTVEFNSDFTTLTVYSPSTLTEEEKAEIYNFLHIATTKAYMIQALDGISPKDTCIKYIEKDIVTGEIKCSYDLTPSFDNNSN